MMVSLLHTILIFFLFGLVADCYSREDGQEYREELLLRHLPDEKILASFQLTTRWRVHPLLLTHSHSEPIRVRHYGIFPKSLAEVVAHYGVQELHLSLTRGKWRTGVWGYPPLSAPPGAEFWAWFLPDIVDIDDQWKGLVNAVSGLMCASLNAISSTNTHQPPRSFKPQGAVFGNLSSSLLRYAALPREPVCTENLTPWTKLLPCGNKAGMGKLLTALRLYDAHYHSLGFRWVPVCKDEDCSTVSVEFQQLLTVVLNTDKIHSTKWSLSSVFSTPVSSCPLSSQSVVYVDTTSNLPVGVSLIPLPSREEKVTYHGATANLAVYDLLTANGSVDISLSYNTTHHPTISMPRPPVLRTHRYVTGSGHEWGGLQTEIINDHTHPLRVVFLDMVPWYFRVMLHTLDVSCTYPTTQQKGERCVEDVVLSRYYLPARDRLRPHTLELLLLLPPASTVSITVKFSRSFLKWTEYPPDAAHGFYINSAVVTTALEQCSNCTPVPASMAAFGWNTSDGLLLQLHTEPLLVSLPTPDFSMPYNVICFVSTVVAIAFGTLFNLTTKTLQPVEQDEARGGLTLLQRLFRLFRRT